MFIKCKYNIANIVQAIAPTYIHNKDDNDLGKILVQLNPNSLNIDKIDYLNTYIVSNLDKIRKCHNSFQVFSLIREVVADLMSCSISIKLIYRYVIDHMLKVSPTQIYDVISLLAETELAMVENNKINFEYELFFIRLSQLMSNTI
jgi:hypothetical protein